ncbi:MAG: chemotaxis protein CheW [Planctomycetes bacterium]|nr:chemotaxis protein CheW [Planctomycetota bacterium]
MNDSFPSDLPADEMSDYVRLYLDETNEQLDSLVEIFLELENQAPTPEELNEAFRLIHSIKGSSALLGLDRITSLTHHLETHFERLRSGKQELNAPTIDIVLRCIDFLRESNQHLQDGEPLSTAGDLLDQVKSLGQSTSASDAPKTQQPDRPQQANAEIEKASPAHEQPPIHSDQKPEESWWSITISVEAGDSSSADAVSKVSQSLAALGELMDSQPPQASLGSTHNLTQIALVLKTFAPEAEIIQTIEEGSFTDFSVTEVPSDTTIAPAEPQTSGVPSRETQGSNKQRVQPDLQHTVTEKAAQETAKPPALAKTVRVDVDRLDVLLNLTGELVVNRARLTQLAENVAPAFHKLGLSAHTTNLLESFRKLTARLAEQYGEKAHLELQDLNEQIDTVGNQLQDWEHNRQSFAELSTAIDQLTRVSNSLQRGVLNTRMVPVGPLFNRFKRSIRDITQELGKQVHLQLEGEKTELDKRMIDEIGDPLNHLIRNCVDHGIESADIRIQNEKPEIATVSLAASHRGNNVFITVQDDGSGIDINRVKQTAVARGIIPQSSAAKLTDDEAAELIFQPGFSTATEISDISGRGVGMDIVRTKIAQLNGTVEVSSKQGVGTKFIIRLPLTLTITRCMLFRLSHGVLAVPIENVREIVSVSGYQSTTANGRQMCDVRGEFLPLVSIDDLFDFHALTGGDGKPSTKQTVSPEKHVVILHAANKSLGLRVDGLLGGQDIVVKSLDENFTHIKGLGGASILGDGSVCLLLDAATCIELAAIGSEELAKEMAAD